MRVRLLIDVNVETAVILALGERCSEQPVVTVTDASDGSTWGGRLMGATPVEGAD
jgi:hypothetical protein